MRLPACIARAAAAGAMSASVALPAAAAPTPADLYANLSPSVWRVVTYDVDGVPLGQGSGVVIGTESLITNCHVLAKARRVSVQLEKAKFDARLEAWDTERDLCQLKVPGLRAPVVAQVSSAELRVGQVVYAIGNPKGLESTLSSGLVSSLRRDDAGRVILIQTSAPISRGSSGGGLFDDQGRLIGLTTLGSVTGDAQNLNFAVPADWIGELPARHAKLNKDVPAGTASTAPPPDSAPGPSVALAPEGTTPRWRRGDEIEYRVTDRFTGTVRKAVYRVDRVEADKVIFNDGARTEGYDGRLIELVGAIAGDMDVLSPPGGWVDDEALTRAGWTSRFERGDPTMRTRYDLQARLDGDTTIETPAGAFQAVRVSYDGWAQRRLLATPAPIPLRIKVRLWYAPALKRVVRFESEVTSSGPGVYAGQASREVAELVRPRANR